MSKFVHFFHIFPRNQRSLTNVQKILFYFLFLFYLLRSHDLIRTFFETFIKTNYFFIESKNIKNKKVLRIMNNEFVRNFFNIAIQRLQKAKF